MVFFVKGLVLVFLLLVGGMGCGVGLGQVHGVGVEGYPHPELFEELPGMVEPMGWWVYVLLLLGGVLLLWFLVWLVMRERPLSGVVRPPALKTALRKLERLRGRLEVMEVGEAAHEVSVILREYQELRDDVPALYRSSEELYDRESGVAVVEFRERFAPLAEVHDRLAFGPQLSRREDVRELIIEVEKVLLG